MKKHQHFITAFILAASFSLAHACLPSSLMTGPSGQNSRLGTLSDSKTQASSNKPSSIFGTEPQFKDKDPTMAAIDEKYPVDVDNLKARSKWDEIFLQAKDYFKQRQAGGEVPSDEQLFQMTKQAAVEGQRFFEVDIPYYENGPVRLGETILFQEDENGNPIEVSRNYWRSGGGDQLGRGKDVIVYHNIEGVNASGSDVGWINQSTNERTIANGGNPPVDMHGGSLPSNSTSAGCKNFASSSDFPNWKNFQTKMQYAIMDNYNRGLRPFASYHVGTEYAIKPRG